MHIMTATNSGFEIAEKDLELRGPGEIEGTRQSGALNFKLASLVLDRSLLEIAKEKAASLLDADTDLSSTAHYALRQFLHLKKGPVQWSKIS
jgi:ATP-dependent DNA helicase RecG